MKRINLKKSLALLMVLTMLFSVLAGCAADNTKGTNAQDDEKKVSTGEESKDNAGFSGPISVLTAGPDAVALEEVMQEYNKKYPDVELETIVFKDDAAKNAIIASRIASGDLPDVILSVLNTQVTELAKGGYLMPITDYNFQDRLADIDYSLAMYDGDLYALPTVLSIAGLFANNEVLEKYGIDEYPTSLDELVNVCKQLQEAGFQEPFVVAAKEVNPLNAFVYQYIYENKYVPNPDWYAEILRGETHWNDEAFTDVYEGYGKLKPYMNKDALGLDDIGAVRKFALSKAAFIVGYGFGKDIRTANPELDYSIIPAPFNEDPENIRITTDAGSVYMITTNATNPELCVDFLDFLTLPENASIYSTSIQNFSAVKGAKTNVDPAGDYLQEKISEGFPTTLTMTRTWMPGIKEHMKKATQEWFAGKDIQEVCDNIEKEHQRLMKASPDFVETFLATYKQN